MNSVNRYAARNALPLTKHGNRTFRDPGDISKYNLANFIVDENGCHVWQGAINEKGYAIVGREGYGTFRAARLAYMRDKGPLSPGVFPDHTCRNRACVNAEHLEPVTNAENARRGAKAKLTWDDVREIRGEYAAKRTPFRTLAKRYGISGCAISNIINHKRWQEAS